MHPQSIVHSMVEFTDGATIAQLSLPDMRLPIGYALAYPDRIGTPFGRIDWAALRRLDFEPPDLGHLPLPRPGLRGRADRARPRRPGSTPPTRWRWRRSSTGGSAGSEIADVLSDVLSRHDGAEPTDVDAVIAADAHGTRRGSTS